VGTGYRLDMGERLGPPNRASTLRRQPAKGEVELKERRHPRQVERLGVAEAAQVIRSKVDIELGRLMPTP
jgi:hypothetical protein